MIGVRVLNKNWRNRIVNDIIFFQMSECSYKLQYFYVDIKLKLDNSNLELNFGEQSSIGSQEESLSKQPFLSSIFNIGQIFSDYMEYYNDRLSVNHHTMGMASFFPHQPAPTLKFKNQQLQIISSQFCLTKEQIHRLYSCFSSFQTKTQAFLTLDDLAQNLHHSHSHFSQLPFLERLFAIISRKTPGKLFFQEYLVGISTFCLMNNEAILHFVFDWLDRDGDGCITREDIAQAIQYQNPKTRQKTFFSNFMLELDRNLKENQQILEFQSFRQLSNKLLFLIWPAYQLQQRLRERNMGISFWQNQYQKIQKAEQALRNNQKRSVRMQQKIGQLNHLKVREVIKQPTLREQITMRMPKQAATDLQLLEVNKPVRRKSCPYVKAKFSSRNENPVNQNDEPSLMGHQ